MDLRRKFALWKRDVCGTNFLHLTIEKKRYKNGKKSTLAKARKAVKQGRVHLVSVAWVAACAASNMLELESEYKIADTVRLF